MKFIGKILYLTICTAFVILPLFWIPKGFVYTSEEANSINYDIKLDKASTAWTKDNGFGSINDPSNQSLLFPNAVFYRAVKNLGFDSSTTQKYYISFIFLSISIGFGLLSSLFTKRWSIRCLGLLFYICNFYMVSSLGYTAKTLQLALMPGIFFFFYKYLKTKDVIYIAFNFIWLFIFQAVFTNLPLAITSLTAYPVALLFFISSEKSWKPKEVIIQSLLLLFSVLPILFYHVIIFLPVITDVEENPSRYAFSAVGAPIDLILQMRGVWWEKSGHQGIYYFNLSYFYDNPVVRVFSTACSITILACLTLIACREDLQAKIKSSFWLIMYLVSTGFAAGFYFLPGFFPWLFEVMPGMVMFREPWAKFIPITLLSISVGLVVSLDFLRGYKKLLFYVIFAVVSISTIIQSYPFLSGKIIDGDALGWKRRLVNIPEYWREYERWTEGKEGVLLAVPFGTTPFNSLRNWYPGEQGNSILPLPVILGKMNVLSDSSPIDKYSTILKEFVSHKNFDLLKLGGLNYVLIQDDLEILGNFDSYDWQKEKITEYIEDTPVAVFGDKVKVYKVKSDYTIDTIYSARGMMSVDKGQEEIGLSQLSNLGKGNILSYKRDLNLNGDQYLSLNSPETTFVKDSETAYHGKIEKINGPFVIVLNQSFHRGWKINVSDESDNNNPSTSIPHKIKHFIVNGFSNGWYIDPADICKNTLPTCVLDYEITFSPQKPFSIALFVNVALVIISILTLLSIFTFRLFRLIIRTWQQS